MAGYRPDRKPTFLWQGLLIVLPVLVVSGLLASRGSPRGQLIWLGALSYLVYTFVIYAFAIGKAGFVLATTAILLLLMRGFGGVSWTRSLLLAVFMVLVTYITFVQLGVPLPSGPLPF